MNPFLQIENPQAWGPGSFEMALRLVTAAGIRPGMRVLEVGGGSGQIAATIAKNWNVHVITLEPWSSGTEIQAYAESQRVGDKVLAMKLQAQYLPFADQTFNAIISIGSFEMIGDERPQALTELMRVLKRGGRIGIAEPMCLQQPVPPEVAQLDDEHHLGFQASFRSVAWNRDLFTSHGLRIVEAGYYPEARQWWFEYRDQRRISDAEQALITLDDGRWISLGLVVGEKA